jgi:hypothetical protein
MTKSWKRFAYIQLPVAAVVLALGAQLMALALSNVPRALFRADQLAMAVLSDPQEYRILLLGDSKTSRATARFALGDGAQVANLSTQMFIGLSGSLFLVQRYLETHAAPEHIVLAISPQLYHFENNLRLSRYHLWHTFSRPNERDFLRTNHPGMSRRDQLPAILDLQERVLDPIVSLVKLRVLAARGGGPLTIPGGWIVPTSQAPVMHSTNSDRADEDQVSADERDLSLAPVNAAVLTELCTLSAEKGFAMHFAWPPMPSSVADALSSSAALLALEAQMRRLLQGRCKLGGFFDFNKRRTYLNSSFQHDRLHLFGDGWEQRYAGDLREYLGGLLGSKARISTQ